MNEKFLADECVAGSTVGALRVAGFDITWVAEMLAGANDREVLARAYDCGRLLLTEDKDFGELTIRFGYPCHGIVLIALAGLPSDERATRTLAALEALGDQAVGHFVVVEARRIRRRPLHYPRAPSEPSSGG